MTKITAFIQAALTLLANILKSVGVAGDEYVNMIGTIGNEVVTFGEGVDGIIK